jgi:glutathione S-transferase
MYRSHPSVPGDDWIMLWQSRPMQTAKPLVLTGYRHSIYTRIARMVLLAKGADFIEAEVNPFAPPLPPDHPHPFGRVPVLSHGTFTLFETCAIARYADLALPGPSLTPQGPQAAARMAQVISIADAYAFRPLVLQVYAHRVFRPVEGRLPDEAQIAAGLAAAPAVLSALEAIAREGLVLNAEGLTLADCHLAPMIAAFVEAPESDPSIAAHPALSGWWNWVRQRRALVKSGRPLPSSGVDC